MVLLWAGEVKKRESDGNKGRGMQAVCKGALVSEAGSHLQHGLLRLARAEHIQSLVLALLHGPHCFLAVDHREPEHQVHTRKDRLPVG